MMFSSELKNILIEYDPNVMRPDQGKIDPKPFFESLTDDQKKSLSKEFDELVGNSDFSQHMVNQYSGEEFENDRAARKFLSKLQKYLFGTGEEPDISDYLA